MLKLILSCFVSLGFLAAFASIAQAAVEIQQQVVVSTCVEPIATPNPANFGIVHHRDSDGYALSTASYTLNYRQLVKKIVVVSGLLGQVTQIPVNEEQNLSQDFERTTSAYDPYHDYWDREDKAASDWVVEDIKNFIVEQAPLLCK